MEVDFGRQNLIQSPQKVSYLIGITIIVKYNWADFIIYVLWHVYYTGDFFLYREVLRGHADAAGDSGIQRQPHVDRLQLNARPRPQGVRRQL